MHVTYDRATDTAYLRVDAARGEVVTTTATTDRVFLDWGADGRLVGVELLAARDPASWRGAPHQAVLADGLRRRGVGPHSAGGRPAGLRMVVGSKGCALRR